MQALSQSETDASLSHCHPSATVFIPAAREEEPPDSLWMLPRRWTGNLAGRLHPLYVWANRIFRSALYYRCVRLMSMPRSPLLCLVARACAPTGLGRFPTARLTRCFCSSSIAQQVSACRWSARVSSGHGRLTALEAKKPRFSHVDEP